MTSKDAFDKVKGFIFELRDIKYIEYKKYTDILNDLVERDTPKEANNPDDDDFYCPECNSWVSYECKDKYCSECGQKLDWSEE